MKKIIIIICALLLGSILTIFLIDTIDKNNDLVNSMNQLENKNNDLVNSMDQLEKKNKELNVSIVSYTNKISKLSEEKDSLLEEIDQFEKDLEEKEKIISMNQTQNNQSLGYYEYSYYRADDFIGVYEALFQELKSIENDGARKALIDNIVLPSYIKEDDLIMDMEVVSVDITNATNADYINSWEIVELEGQYTITGYIDYDFAEYGTYFIHVEDLSSIPYMASKVSNSLEMWIAMIDSKDRIEELGYEEGDYITVILDGLTLARAFGKPLANSGQFVEIVE